MQRELRAQRYAEVAELAGMADALARLARGNSHAAVANNHSSTPRPLQSSTPIRKAASAPAKRKVPTKRGAAKRNYPRFERDDDKLVKIGWSKKAREEYEHRAPFGVAESLVATIGRKYKAGELFSAADVLPLHDHNGDLIPDYQFYSALKWLHTEGVVTKHGRDRYAIEPGHLDDNTLERLWAGLPKFKGASR